MIYKDFADRIIKMKNADLALRDKLILSGQLGNGYNEEMEKLHNSNAAILDEIIDRIGYPTEVKVGKEANEASWLLIQHAIGVPDFMKKCLTILQNTEEGNKKETAQHLAYLSDRIAVFEGKPQLYGTQFDWDKAGNLSPNSYDDLTKVNLRRKAIGLISLQEQTEVLRQRAEIENQSPPVDFEKRELEIYNWKIKVGWLK